MVHSREHRLDGVLSLSSWILCSFKLLFVQLLKDKKVHIWDGNGSKEYLSSIGLVHRREGDLGPVYGFQWRHFGASYTTADADYTGQGVDQLREVLDKIVNDPTNRRILLCAWNPAGLSFLHGECS